MVIPALHRKLSRDLWGMKMQILTIAFVIAGGIASTVSSLSVVKSLQTAQERFYLAGRFADVFSDLKRAPLNSLSLLDDKKSITEYTARVQLPGRVWKSGLTAPLSARLQTYQDPLRDLNRLFLLSGRWPFPNQNEVLINEAFFQGAGFQLEDDLNIIAEGQNQIYKIVGVVLSPEFIYTLKPGAFLPDNKHFGVLWGPYEKLSKDFGYDRAFNSLVVRSAEGIAQEQVIQDVDDVLSNYGGLGAYGRDSQQSHFFVTDELRQQRVTAVAFPSVFLIVSGFLLNMILGRLVNSQRQQIAILRALGYSKNKITSHYLSYMLVIVGFGGALGFLLAYWQGSGMITMYKTFFRFPTLPFLWSWSAMLLAIVAVLVFGTLAIFQVLWKIRRLQPAEALHAQTPVLYKGHAIDWLLRNLSLKPTYRMILRSLLSRPGRTVISVIGLAFSSVILILGIFWWDAIKYLISVHFNKVLKADTIISFVNPVPHDAVLKLNQNREVLRAEGYRQVPVKIHYKNKNVLTIMEAFVDEQELKNPLDKNFHPIERPSTGLMLSRGWADKLNVKTGETVEVETLENIKRRFPLQVTKIVEDLIGSQAYIDATLARELLQEGVAYNSILLKLDPANTLEFSESLKLLPAVASVDTKMDAIKSFNESTAKMILIFATALLAFAMLIAVGVIYNAGRISLAEKAGIFSSLRILGFTHQEIFEILQGEILVLTLLSLPIGSILGYFLAKASVGLMHTETFRLPMHIEPRSFVIAVVIVLGASLFTALVLRDQVRRLDIISTLKGQE